MSLQLQPKIKQHQECGECGASGDLQLIEIFMPPKCEDDEEVANAISSKKDLCGHCAVGQDVPVNRQTEGWTFGEVIRYDSDGSQLKPFLVSFPDGSEEWTDIARRPSLDYLAFIRSTTQSQQATGAIGHTDWLDKFSFIGADSQQMLASLSSFGSSSSVGTFEPNAFGPSIFPLFNDDRLFDVEHLEFVDEDVDMQDSSNSTQDSSKGSASMDDVVMKPPMKRKAAIMSLRSPNRWTKEEDQLLLKIMDSFSKKGIKPMWPEVADLILTRNGKQCRERYINHLSSALKPKIWHPIEDANIVYLFSKHGTKWSQIAKWFVGRTDNGIKNRFHYLRRWMEKDYRKKYENDGESMSIGDDMAASMHKMVRKMIVGIATESKGGLSPQGKYTFGKLKEVKRITSCKRCCLFVPSSHTGNKICQRTGWCEACVCIPTYIMGDNLRACLNLRMTLDDFMLE